MKSNVLASLFLVSVGLVLLSACASEEPSDGVQGAPPAEVADVAGEAEMMEEEAAEEAPAATAAPQTTDVDAGAAGSAQSDTLTRARRSDRLIIKNAEIRLLVADSDAAIDRATQVVEDVGGYIVSSRVWYEQWGDENVKYSTITIGVPSDQFEQTLRRLRDIAVRVLDENASGQDVTDEYVDLQAQLENLEATRDRIRSFLDQADTVEEALQVNEELSRVEGQIEEIQGRINYLSDRAAYSTITIHIEPELGELPTPTPLPTPTLQPTSTPRPWNPSATYGRAKATMVNTYRGLLDILIWIGVAVLPIVAPFAVIGWVVWRMARRGPKRERPREAERPSGEEADNS